MRAPVTWSVTVWLHGGAPGPVQSTEPWSLINFGLAKPMETWYPAGPNSWKYSGSLILRKASWSLPPSRVLVCSHSSPRAIRSAAGVATTPYLPGGMPTTIACPASGERVVPSASYFGQTGITPVMPVGLSAPSNPAVGFAVTGHASSVGTGSMGPATPFDNGRLNSS